MVDPTYSPIVANMIHDLPECKEFLRADLQIASLPPIVAEELAA
jgi:hypothetical protein